jgi:hypothetical protein
MKHLINFTVATAAVLTAGIIMSQFKNLPVIGKAHGGFDS